MTQALAKPPEYPHTLGMAVAGAWAPFPEEPPPGYERELHQALAARNHSRLAPALPGDRPVRPRTGGEDKDKESGALVANTAAEQQFVESERAAVRALCRDVPSQPHAFVNWFDGLRETGPGQGDPLFPWLAQHCSLAQMRWFLGQEVAGEAGFDDLVALTQLKMPVPVKLEMARNYWDEMGQGRASAMHGPMLERLADGLAVKALDGEVIWQSLALGNLMLALAFDRHYAYHSVGALGIVELTAPGRSHHVNAGLRRLEVPPALRQYFALHATLDVKHATTWKAEVLVSLLEAAPPKRRPAVAVAMAEGALMRLTAGARCFAAYRQHFGLSVIDDLALKASPAHADAHHRTR